MLTPEVQKKLIDSVRAEVDSRSVQDADKSRLLEEKAQDGRAICGRGGGGQVAHLARRECVESV